MATASNLRKNLPEKAYMLDILTRNAAHFLLILYCKLYRSYMSRDTSVSTFFDSQIVTTGSNFCQN